MLYLYRVMSPPGFGIIEGGGGGAGEQVQHDSLYQSHTDTDDDIVHLMSIKSNVTQDKTAHTDDQKPDATPAKLKRCSLLAPY